MIQTAINVVLVAVVALAMILHVRLSNQLRALRTVIREQLIPREESREAEIERLLDELETARPDLDQKELRKKRRRSELHLPGSLSFGMPDGWELSPELRRDLEKPDALGETGGRETNPYDL